MKRQIIGITGRKINPLARKAAKLAIGILQKRNIAFEVDSNFLKSKSSKPLQKFRSGIVLSFGGDGTLLQVFRELKKNSSVVGINCGSRGFLQSFHHSEIELALQKVLSGRLKFEERARIVAKIDGKVVGQALNEVLIVPAKAGRLLKYKLKIGTEQRYESGDGLIVATPTGSTAHALSAGGPIVKGNAKVFVVVSMNPVDWSHRPLIINDHEKVLVYEFEKGKAQAIIDGQQRFSIKKKVEILKGRPVRLARKY